MKRLYLASSIDITAGDIARSIGGNTGKLKLAFISTAAEVEEGEMDWLDNDREGLVKAGFDLFDYTITGKSYDEINKDLGKVDVIHVNGGNAFYLLLQARRSGFDKWIKEVVGEGRIYIGSSSGSIIASPNIEISRKIETKIYEEDLKTFEGLGLVDFIALPHWGSEDFKDLYLNSRLDVIYKPENKIILLNDWQYVKVEDEMYQIVEVDRSEEVQE